MLFVVTVTVQICYSIHLWYKYDVREQDGSTCTVVVYCDPALSHVEHALNFFPSGSSFLPREVTQ